MDNNEFRLSLELALKIEQATGKAKYTPELVNSLADPEKLLLFKEVLEGRMEICPLESVINLGVEPLLDGKLTVYQHERYRSWRFDPEQIKFYRSPVQIKGQSIRGGKLLKERGINNQCLANACLFDWFRRHRERIPPKFNSTGIGNRTFCFPGTTCRDGESHLGVLSLVQLQEEWFFKQFVRLEDLWPPNYYVLYIDPPVSR